MQLARNGDLNYRAAMEKAGQLSSGVGISTRDPVKMAILTSGNFTALCTRAAIEGGLTPDTAYTVGDSYIQSLAECKTIADVRTINHAMFEDFIRRVNSHKQSPPQYSQQIRSCAAYIEAHLDEELTLEKLAAEVGYSEYYLSRKFKAETGKNIRDYIREVRMERAKLLLATSDLGIRETVGKAETGTVLFSYFRKKEPSPFLVSPGRRPYVMCSVVSYMNRQRRNNRYFYLISRWRDI